MVGWQDERLGLVTFIVSQSISFDLRSGLSPEGAVTRKPSGNALGAVVETNRKALKGRNKTRRWIFVLPFQGEEP
jgi:hypothetical protein